MSNPRSLRRAFPCLLACALGCTHSENDIAECKVRESPLASDEQPSPALGFAPAAVLSWAVGERTAAAQWLVPAPGTHANVTGETGLTLGIERADGPAVELVGEAEYCGSDALRIPITLAARTDDGALHERLSGSLVATRAEFARASAELDLGQLDGTLVYDTDDPKRRLFQPQLSLALNRDGHAGAMLAGLEERSNGGVSMLPSQPLLTWPAGSACGGAISRAPTADWQIRNLMGSVWRVPEANDGAAYATVDVTMGGELCDDERGETSAPATVRVRYSSRTDVTFPGRLVRVEDRFELQVPAQARLGGSPADFVARFGDFDMPLMHYEHVELEIELVFYPKSAMVPNDARGVLSVVAYENDCKPACTSTMCSGCGPSERRVVFRVGLDGRL